MNAATPVGPTRPSDRLEHLDILRGFALLGILMVNFEYFTHSILVIIKGADPALEGFDRVVDWWIQALFEGKFYALFSMLFGAGFALMLERSRAAGRGFYPLYLRRLGLLAAFGLAHGVLIWPGDILLVYALTGFLMALLFRNTPRRRLVKWAVFFLLIPVLLMGLFTASFELSGGDEQARAAFVAEIERRTAELDAAVARGEAVYATGTWLEATAQRIRDLGYLLSQALFWIPPVLGFFLIGRWMVVSGRLVDPEAHAGFFDAWMKWGLGAGLLLCIGATRLIHGLPLNEPSVRLTLGMLAMTAGAPVLMLGFSSALVLYRHKFGWLAPAGRMALTNYLLQSLFWTWVFAGYGLGLWDQIARAWHPPLVVAFFAAQVMLSQWWMARFRFGPAEWLWRSLTYLRVQPLR